MRSPSDEADSPTHNFVSTTNSKRHTVSDKWGFPICEDGDVGRRVIALGVPGDATGLNIGYRGHVVMNLHCICPVSRQ